MRLTMILAAAVAAQLSGCGTMAQVQQEQAGKRAAFERSIPVCTGEEQCKVAWATARNWVITNCGMKIQNIADGYIETYGSTTTALACRVMGEPRGPDTWALVIRTTCGNMFGCIPDSWDSAFQFNQRVAAAIGYLPQTVPDGSTPPVKPGEMQYRPKIP